MERDNFDKQMSMTNKKEKIFNVRKVHYKQFDHEKYLKPTFTPFNIKKHSQQPMSAIVGKKGGQYHNQVAIISSPAYKQLARKYNLLKQQHSQQKQRRLQQLRIKQEQLNRCKSEKERIIAQKIKIVQRRDQLSSQIQYIRGRSQMLKAEYMQRQQEYRFMNMEYLRDMVIGMRYQNGMDIDLDNMTYEQLLQLQENMGSVSKGLTEEQIQKLPRKTYKQNQPQELCSICYYNAKDGQQMTVLHCRHTFHTECIKEWLLKQKMCPMCKQEIVTKIKSSKKLNAPGSQIKINSIEQIFKDNDYSQSQEDVEDIQGKAQQQLIELSNLA